MNHKRGQRPRAVSPAIATIALIGLAIVAAGVVGSYVMSQSSTLKQDLSADILEAHLVQLRKNANDWNAGISFKNTGTVDITNVRIDIRLNDGTVWTISGVPIGGSASPGETKRIDGTTTTTQISSGRGYTFTLIITTSVAGETYERTYIRTVTAEGL
ncbi:MAG TPA: archaellin/type IV pilin N-terminal domain-containing protein [Nitrososphaera sp.]|jgi:FlaG/FlaF family flagellin (archaellin)